MVFIYKNQKEVNALTTNFSFLPMLQLSNTAANAPTKARTPEFVTVNRSKDTNTNDFRAELKQATSTRSQDKGFAKSIRNQNNQGSLNRPVERSNEKEVTNSSASARENRELKSVEKPAEKQTIEEVDKKEKEETVENSKDKKTLNSLMELLEMLKLLDPSIMQLQVNQEDTVKLSENLEKLQTLINELEVKLTEIPDESGVELKKTFGELKQLMESSKVNANETKKDTVVPEKLEKNTSFMDKLNNSLERLTGKLEKAISVLEQKVKVSEKATAETYASEILPNDLTVKQDKAKVFDNQRYKVQVANTEEVEAVIEPKDLNQTSMNNNTNDSDEALKYSNQSDDKASVDSSEQTEVKLDNTGIKQVEGFSAKLDTAVKNVEVKDTAVHSTQKSSEAQGTEIIKQIVKKAEVILKNDKSEMIMKLEPEALGKLNLKVIVENGKVEARFVAENYQVKEAIEANFNQLKDMLQQKGIAVQGFSVSVGQENKEFNQRNNLNIWKESLKGTSKKIGSIGYAELNSDEPINSINPYTYHDGKVDFKA